MYKYLLPLCLAAGCWPAHASDLETAPLAPQSAPMPQTAGPLTLQTALSLALAAGANPELSAARHELLAVDGAVRQAGLRSNPSLSLERLDTRRDTRETTLQLSQPLELGGQRAARVLAAERGRDSAAAGLAVKQAGLRADVIDAWFAVLAAQEQSLLARQAAALAQRATLTVARRVAAGKVSPVEQTKAQVAEANVGLELTRADGALGWARKRLAVLWGDPAPRFDRVDGDLAVLPELPSPEALSRQLARSPAMARARAELERHQALARLELARRAPAVTLNIGGKHSGELERTQLIFGVSLPLPLFDRNQGAVLESARRVDQARDEVAATTARLDGELARALTDLDVARRQAIVLRTEILPGARGAYEAASTGFEYGKFGFLDVLDAQRTLLQAQSHYLTTLADAHRAVADIARIVGEE